MERNWAPRRSFGLSGALRYIKKILVVVVVVVVVALQPDPSVMVSKFGKTQRTTEDLKCMMKT